MNWRTNDSHVVSQGPCTASGCSSRDAKTTYSDGHAYCFSCQTYFPAEHRNRLMLITGPKPKTDNYPTRIVMSEETCPHNWAWLKQYQLTDKEILDNFFYAPLSQRHVFGYKNPITEDEFFEARAHSPMIRPKSLQNGLKPTIFMGQPESEFLVIVEDIVSAIKVGRQARVMPLFGSYLSNGQMADIGREKGITQCIVWLDCDKYNTGMSYAKMLGMLKPTVAIQTLADPKQLTDDAITVALESALESLEAVCENN